jgi:hypothetical protein
MSHVGRRTEVGGPPQGKTLGPNRKITEKKKKIYVRGLAQ